MQSAHEMTEAADLDTAIFMAGLGKFHIQLAMVIGGCLASTTIDNLGIGFVLPDVECELELSALEMGIFSGATYLGMMLTVYGWRFASDTFGRRATLILSLGISWLSSFSASLSPVFWLIVCLRFLSGAASAGMASTIYTYMAEFLPPKQRIKFFNWTAIPVAIAFCLIPASAWLILPLTWKLDLGFVVIKSWRLLCILNGSYVLVTFLGMLLLPESPKYLVSVDKHQEAIEVLRRVFSINTGRPPNEYPVHEIRNTAEDGRTVKIKTDDKLSVLTILKTMKNQVVPIFGRKHLCSTILACVLQFCMFSSSYGFYLWMPDILNRMMSYNSANPYSPVTVCDAINIRLATASNATCQSEINPMMYVSALVTGANYCVGSILAGLLLNTMSKKTALASLQFVGGVAAFGLHWATDLPSVTIFLTVYIVLSGICIVPLNSMISKLYPTHLRSSALCVTLAVGALGSSLTGNIIGVLLEYDCASTIFGLGAMSFGAGFLFFLIPSPTKMIEPVA